MKKTKNYAMPYPEQDDYFNVEDFQDMMVSVDDLMKKLSDSGAQISSDAEHLYNQTKAQMDNIQKRMNAFTALGDGSTTGDAELKDIRVAYDGKEYGNAGEAVREQASDMHKALFGAGASIWSKAKSESTKYVVETKGICILNERFTAAGVVAKISRGTFAQNESTLNLDRECSAYIVEFEKNPGTVYMPSAETIKIVSTTKIIFEANGNARCWIPVEKGQYLAVDSTATAYTSESNHVPYMLYDQANKTLECRGFGSAGSIEPVDPYSLALEYKLEYDMDDTGLVKQIDANREAAASLKEDIDVGKETSESEISLIQIKGSYIWNTQQAFTSRNGILYKSDTSNAQYCKVRLEEGVTYKYIGGYPKSSYPALVFAAEGAIGTDKIGREALFYSTDNTGKTLEYTFVKPVDAEYLYINTMNINVSYSPKLYKVEVTKIKIKDVVQNNANRIKKIESNTDSITDKPKIHIGSKIFAVVNDTLQIFKKSIFEGVTDSHICKISCQKGKVYPRYFEYTPSSSDVGEMDILFEIYDLKGNTLASKTAKIKTVLASNPSSAKHILCIGDSTTYAGEYPLELSRRLKGTRGVATSPSPLTLSNYNVVGRLNKNGVGWEGTGGWTYSTYNSAGTTAVRFHVANASNIGIGDIIQISANNQKGYYRFQVEEVNVTNGNGEIRVMFYQTPHTSTFLSEVSVNGDISNTTSIKVGEYTSLSVETYQPFWNNSQNKFDMESYVTTYCNGKCDYIFILLGINNLIGSNPFGTAYNNIFNDCKILLRNIHSQLPNAKIFLSTNPLVSQNGGIGANYNSNDVSGSFDEKGWNHKIFEMNELYFELETDSEFTEYVTVVNTHAQFDSDYGYPFTQKPVNTRFSTNEVVGTNAVHPTNQGYWMIADALFRILLSN